MPLFPDHQINGADQYFDGYTTELTKAFASVSRTAILQAENLLMDALKADSTIFSCGNGGSAAISNHLLCDWLKGVQKGTDIKPRVHSLSSASELMTAIANDISVEDIFALPLRSLARPGDLLVAISSSGASPNILKAMRVARATQMKVIALTGFSGGTAALEADISLHVDAENYGIIEDVHQSIMHVLAQSLRMRNLGPRTNFLATVF